MGLGTWMRDLDERLGLRPRRGPFDCLWCESDEHAVCTGMAVRPRLPGATVAGLHRLSAESQACACHLRAHD